MGSPWPIIWLEKSGVGSLWEEGMALGSSYGMLGDMVGEEQQGILSQLGRFIVELKSLFFSELGVARAVMVCLMGILLDIVSEA